SSASAGSTRSTFSSSAPVLSSGLHSVSWRGAPPFLSSPLLAPGGGPGGPSTFFPSGGVVAAPAPPGHRGAHLPRPPTGVSLAALTRFRARLTFEVVRT